MSALSEPQAGEYNPYYESYVSFVKGKNIADVLRNQIDDVRQAFGQLGEEGSQKAYAAGKWTGKELLGHITDTDRIMAYRALCIARGEQAALPGYDENAYASNGFFNGLSLGSLLDEFEASRYALLALLKNLPEATHTIKGNANNSPVSVRALFYIIAGHTEHHLNILKTRYF
ncbi:DinB family protein [Cecembia lonarensis]|uniref:DinB superfamily protein n=1 Tax=Cecembia lonarensis (strain CCUG 58316 / KCTC 22772 / LW9) TaxID=1225176 RepID=K1L3J3_CECL9|nr:DinB family protein [Cecembia lonarensis]EKB49396.1 DinB superfamily protein [Cecembia lonarensis LW9]